MAIKVFVCDNESELKEVLSSLEKGKAVRTLPPEIELPDYNDPVVYAIETAKSYQEDFLPFTYDDVGLTYEKRNHRAAFRDWAAKNDIECKHVKGARKSGSLGIVFYPFYTDEQGQKILAAYPEG